MGEMRQMKCVLLQIEVLGVFVFTEAGNFIFRIIGKINFGIN